MKNIDVTQTIADKLMQASQKLEEGELAAAFELVEEIQIEIDEEKRKIESAIEEGNENDILKQLINIHGSLKRKLLKEMTKKL